MRKSRFQQLQRVLCEGEDEFTSRAWKNQSGQPWNGQPLVALLQLPVVIATSPDILSSPAR